MMQQRKSQPMDNWTSYVLIISGWLAVHLFSAHRDKQKEWREFSRETAKFIDKIEKSSIIYHTSNTRNTNLEKKIKLDLNGLDTRFSLIKKHLRLHQTIAVLRAAITLDNFETSNFTNQNYRSEIIQSIAFEANLLREALYDAESKNIFKF